MTDDANAAYADWCIGSGINLRNTGIRRMKFEIVCDDILKVMPEIITRKIHATITDPPYGMDLKSGGMRFRHMRKVAGDETQEIGQHVLDTLWDYCPVLAFSQHARPWGGDWRQSLIWDKGPAVGIGGHRATMWKCSHEIIQVGKFKKVFGKRDCSVLNFHIVPQNYKYHVCQKPVALMEYLIEKLTSPGDVVFDPFCGSGSTGVACMRTGREFIGVEVDEQYAEIARKRIASASGTHERLFDCSC